MDELREELGIEINLSDLHHFSTYKAVKGNEFQGIFIVKWDGDPQSLGLEPDEVKIVNFLSVDYLNRLLIEEHQPDWSIAGYSADILSYIKGLHL